MTAQYLVLMMFVCTDIVPLFGPVPPSLVCPTACFGLERPMGQRLAAGHRRRPPIPCIPCVYVPQ